MSSGLWCCHSRTIQTFTKGQRVFPWGEQLKLTVLQPQAQLLPDPRGLELAVLNRLWAVFTK
jgi:hypothetical protein